MDLDQVLMVCVVKIAWKLYLLPDFVRDSGRLEFGLSTHEVGDGGNEFYMGRHIVRLSHFQCHHETTNQSEFQDPKMEVLYHIRPYSGGTSPYIALT